MQETIGEVAQNWRNGGTLDRINAEMSKHRGKNVEIILNGDYLASHPMAALPFDALLEAIFVAVTAPGHDGKVWPTLVYEGIFEIISAGYVDPNCIGIQVHKGKTVVVEIGPYAEMIHQQTI